MSPITSFLGAALVLFPQLAVSSPLAINHDLHHRAVSASTHKFSVKTPSAFTTASDLKVTDKVLSLKAAGTKAKSSKALHAAIRAKSGLTYLAPLTSAEGGASYAIDIEYGGTTFDVIFDTGSSDLWLAAEDVECVNLDDIPQDDSYCAFGPLAPSTFEDGAVDGETFDITYGDGEFLEGTMGYEDVTIAGVTVKKQEVALVDYAYWSGDNVTSGLVGFAYPSLTSAYEGTTPVEYNNWIFSAIDQGLVAPMFSLALERSATGGSGQLALGGLPDVNVTESDFTSTPLQILEVTDIAAEAKNYSYYTIIPDGFILEGHQGSGSTFHAIDLSQASDFPVVVDSGTTLMYLPPKVAEEVNALFDPPAVYIEEEGIYETDCWATPPDFKIRINGTDFTVNKADMLLTGSLGYDSYTGGCVTGVQPQPGGPYILGDVFLKSVVAVFDVGSSEMRFAKHDY